MQTIVESHLDGAHEFCAGVRRMYNQCDFYKNGDNIPSWQRGKAGPKGEKGERGSNISVDYDTVEQIIQGKLENVTFELMQKYVELQAIVDRHSTQLRELTEESKAMAITDCSKFDSATPRNGIRNDGIFQIYVAGKKVIASCDLSTDSGGWTVIQRRMDGSVNFYRNFSDYIEGFGNLSGEFWIGLDNLHKILQTAERFELRIDMEDWDDVKKFAKYSKFNVGEPEKDYSLTVTGYSGTATDSFSGHSGAKFSTEDLDLDSSSANCAQLYKGGWWYNNCHVSNLNGLYHKGGPHDSFADGVNWHSWKGYYYSLKFVEMKIKPAQG